MAIAVKPKTIHGWSPARQRIVDLVNTGRAALGRKPIKTLPKGWVDDPRGCCLSHALGTEVGTSEDGDTIAYPQRKRDAKRLAKAWRTKCHEGYQCWLVTLPDELSHFAFQFALGMFPDLIEAGAEEPYWWRVREGNTVYASCVAGAGWSQEGSPCA